MDPITIIAIVNAAIAAGVKIEPFIENLIERRKRLQQENRPDVNAAEIEALTAAIDAIQQHIDQKVAAATGGNAA